MVSFGIENGASHLKAARWTQLDMFTQQLLIKSWDWMDNLKSHITQITCIDFQINKFQPEP